MSFVPVVVEQGSKIERSFDIYSRLLRDRIIFVTGEIEDRMSSIIVAQLLFLEAEDPEKDVFLYINSPGGVITSGLAIYDTMQYIKPDVVTICIGQACSMGSVLLTAGTGGKRFALPHSRIMIHQPLGSCKGQATDMEIQVGEITRMKKMLNGIYLKHTSSPLSEIEKKIERDSFMPPQDALLFGLVDGIVEKAEDVRKKLSF
ncbi:ATP-dependent Clp protease proteolytic subunit precursor [Candidatus Cyrtobacter comes]|uniref:ATP-dependent Clp protease proteolytic subunit n=1 Tax=Candidatus Cyrtobacter comes TaxID=675776 RepID=A0ABU5L689_9RICK|nr:ATP-dependent Clp protease proteolytic subunit [Candidatus Cyrtobacter comes]MDZ5761659.1 ATP-dependent Clp protease proteolytic subunit precursor [Candidatus Cyrtobacter comes]